MQDYLLDDDFFDELIKKDQLSSKNIKIMQEETAKEVNIVKVDETLKVTQVKSSSVNSESSENTKTIEMKCGFKSKRVRENDKETADSMLDKYYRWLLTERFMEIPAQKFVGIMRKYHEYSLEDGKDSPLLPCDCVHLKERFQLDIKYIPKLAVGVGKMKVDSARKYYIDFMKDYNKETKK